jgi:hypothetical protein
LCTFKYFALEVHDEVMVRKQDAGLSCIEDDLDELCDVLGLRDTTIETHLLTDRLQELLDTECHCWRHADGRVPFHKVVAREVERNSSLEVFELLGERQRQATSPESGGGKLLKLVKPIAGKHQIEIKVPRIAQPGLFAKVAAVPPQSSN